ncbi:MAG: hypothetical protein ABIQ15_08605 [Nocardioides sp.]
MAERVVLHVGCMKSGTSFLQRTLAENRDALAAQGFTFPGEGWPQQVLAVIDVRGHRRDGEVPLDAVGAWDRLRAQVAAWPGTAIVSMEFLATTPAARIEQIVADLAPARVEAVLTVRDLGRSVPSMWQEGVKNGDTWQWDDFVAAVRDGDPRRPGPARRFWRHQAATPIARRWSRGVGADRFALVTVPPAGSDPALLWRRFCSVVGLDPEPFTLPGPGNESLGAASAQLMRALNERLDGTLTTPDYNAWVKRLAKQVLAPRRSVEPAIGYADPWVAERAEGMITGLTSLGVRVVGDLAELRPVPVVGVAPPDVPVEDELDAAVAAIAHVLGVWPFP